MINKFYLLCVIFSGSPDLTLKTCLVGWKNPTQSHGFEMCSHSSYLVALNLHII